MNCTECSSYNRGKGLKSCLKCNHYLNIIKQSGKRSTINIDIVPDIILEAIPDTKEVNLSGAIKLLPLELSTPLMQYHILGAPLREIAAYNGYDISTASRKINQAVEAIKVIII